MLRRIKRKRIKKPNFGKTLETVYYRLLLKEVRKFKKTFERKFFPKLSDVWNQIISDKRTDVNTETYLKNITSRPILDLLRVGFDLLAEEELPKDQVERLALKLGFRAESFFTKDIARSLEKSFGINVLTESGNLLNVVDTWSSENVALIKNIPQKIGEQIQEVIIESYEKGVRAEQLKDLILERFDVSESRAALIARDQIQKIRSQVRQHRHKNLGIREFIWNAVGDIRTRDEHADLDGKIFEYSNPPDIGMPGYPINCRCWDEPVIYDI